MPADVLLVEDNRSDAMLIQSVVAESPLDVSITFAPDADTAVALVRNPGFQPRFVLTDLYMPKSGIGELLKQCGAKHVPVVVFSSTLNPADYGEVMKLGATEFVEKPIEWDKFRGVVLGIFSKWITHPT